MVDWCTGMINHVAFVLAIQPVMGALHGGRHVNGVMCVSCQLPAYPMLLIDVIGYD